jgi:asparagine synthase (glutamine-hydrolysing)
MIQAMDQPTIDGISTYLIARQILAAGIKVALSGLGGDELFAGYSTFHDVPSMEHFAGFWGMWPRIIRRPAARMFTWLASDADRNRKIAGLAGAKDGVIHPYFLARALFTGEQRNQLLMGVEDSASARAVAPLQEAFSHTRALDPINRVSYLEARCYMLNTLLRDSDVMSMAHGVELRVPLIDHSTCRKVAGHASFWKLIRIHRKPLLVGALHRALPDQVVHRKKRGFTLPFEGWLLDLRSDVDAVLVRIGQGSLGRF